MNLGLPHSLRARLLWLLVAAVSLTAIVQAVIAYRTALEEVDQIFDHQMQEMARSLRPGLPVGGIAEMDVLGSSEENYDFVVQVWSINGTRVFQSTSGGELPQRAAPGFSVVPARGTNYRVFALPTGSQFIQVAQDLAARREMATTLALRTVGPIVVMVPLLVLVVWWVVSASLAPVSRVRQQVAARQADDLSAVNEMGLPNEIRPLVHELNLLLQRMRKAFEAQRHFVSDAAHELRSPLAALKLQVLGLHRAKDNTTRELALTRLTAGIDRSTRLVEQLLVLARHQASATAGVSATPIDLAAVARLAITDAIGEALTRQIDLGISQTEYGPVLGQEGALRILMRNLLDNAIKYTPQGGKVDLAVRCIEDRIILTVDDNGPGIAAEDRERVFDRFYRLPGTDATGSGLGLAIVSAVVDLHGAELSLGVSPSLGGLQVKVCFVCAGSLRLT